MSVVNTYKVVYHFEQGSPNKRSCQDYLDYVQAANGNFSTIQTVLSNNSRIRPGNLVIDAIQEVGHGEGAIA